MQRLWAGLTAAALVLLAIPAWAGMTVTGGSLDKRDGVYYLEAGLDVRLTRVARDALREGVPLVVALRIQVVRERAWWPWGETVVERTRRYRLRYSALAERYRLTALDARQYRNFASLAEMLDEFSQLPSLRIIDASLLDPGERYRARFRAELDLGALPRPMRTLAYISPSWWLASEWRDWRLTP